MTSLPQSDRLTAVDGSLSWRAESIDSDERLHWHFVPNEQFPRKGVQIKEMTDAQRTLAWALLQTGVSARGFTTARSIMELENILKSVEAPNGRFARDHEAYQFSVFGTPGDKKAWGWRFEGHHLSVSMTVRDAEVSPAPVFFGANPARVSYGAQVVSQMQMHILAASYALTSPPPSLPCVWCCSAAPAPSYAQPLQLFHSVVWDALYPAMIANPVGNPISLASNSTLIAPFVQPGQSYQMTLTSAGAAGVPAVAATWNGAPDPTIQIEVTGSTPITYAVPGNSYPSSAVALTLNVTVAAGAAGGLRGITVTNPGDPVQAAMPALLNVVV